METFWIYEDRHSSVSVKGKKDEKAIISRRGNTTSANSINNERACTLQPESTYNAGDLMVDNTLGDTYYIVAKQKSTNGSNQCQLKRTNEVINVVRLSPKYDSKGNKTGVQEVVIHDNIPIMLQSVSANMRLYDAGLLPNTVKKVILPQQMFIDDWVAFDIKLQDRIKIGSDNFQVDAIDGIKYENMFEVQCSADTRKVV